jgi:BolA protein
MSAEHRLREKLTMALQPERLDIINESDQHAGHSGSPGTGESHFRIVIVSDAFAGKSRIERHRMVNEALAGEIGPRVHALALATYAPGETIPTR